MVYLLISEPIILGIHHYLPIGLVKPLLVASPTQTWVRIHPSQTLSRKFSLHPIQLVHQRIIYKCSTSTILSSFNTWVKVYPTSPRRESTSHKGTDTPVDRRTRKSWFIQRTNNSTPVSRIALIILSEINNSWKHGSKTKNSCSCR